MKINSWCKKLSATLVAGGLFMPCAAHAAGLGVNLVVNGDFENVNLNITGIYGGPLVLNWTGPNLFAYSHNGSSSSAGVVPDYADGPDPPSAGNWYFTSNDTGLTNPTDVHDPGVYYQDIDVSTGATAAAIANGTAAMRLMGYMSSYFNDPDFGNVRAEFRDSANQPIGALTISDDDVGPNNVWNLIRSPTIPVALNTASIRVSLWGTAGNLGADGYIDNISLVVSQFADFDGDGDIDIADYLVVVTNLHTNVTALTTTQTFLLGDLTADLRIDGRDFASFRTAFDEANGAGAFVAMLQTVPEPSTGLLAAMGSVLAILRWNRWRPASNGRRRTFCRARSGGRGPPTAFGSKSARQRRI